MELSRSREGQNKPSQKQFATGLGILMATLGSAVGLGNIWKFPYLTGSNGGAAFVILYLICTVVIGLPIMVTEQVIGRSFRGDAISSLKKAAPGKFWWLIGAGGILAAFMIMAFYSEVAGWVFAYIVKSVSGALLTTDPKITANVFSQLIADPMQSLLWQWIVLIVTGVIIMLGITKGIESTTKKLMPLLVIMLVAVGIRSLTLPGASQGLSYLFMPDFSKVTFATVLTAMGLAFFKLSIGMGCMITYGAYYRDDQDIPLTATRVVLSDLAISLLAGIAIFPAVFAFGYEPAAGPALLFITIPSVFASMPFGNIFMVIFFLLTAFAATGAILSLLEVITAFLENQFKLSRVKAALFTVLALMLVGAPAALSSSSMSKVLLFGKNFFDLYDFVSSNILLPVGGLFLAIFAGWVFGLPQFKEKLSNNHTLKNQKFSKVVFFILRYITPPLLLVVLLRGLGLF